MRSTIILICAITLITLSLSAKHNISKKSRKQKSAPLIIGGEHASIKDYPFTVRIVALIRRTFRHVCGGTIITKHFVLTAAHCLYEHYTTLSLLLGFIIIRGGTTNIRGTSGYDHRIYGYVLHEDYDNDYLDNDIALVKVKDPFINLFEKPISYALSNYTYPPEEATTIGWGAIYNKRNATGSEILKYTKTDVLETCQPKYYTYCFLFSIKNVSLHTVQYSDEDFPWLICTSGKNTTTCYGDSGGPLIQNDILIGIASFVAKDEGCVGFAGYTKVGYFENWIKKKMKDIPAVDDLIISIDIEV